ncbi:MAG: PaaI family thioesterase [Tepidiformaceae bacterium]
MNEATDEAEAPWAALMRSPAMVTLGGEMISWEEGRAVLRFPVREEWMNPLGQLQGGIFAAMMDGAMAVAALGIATATLQVSILRPVSAGMLTVTGEVVKAGRRVIYAEAEARDEAGRLVARGNQSGLPRNESGR